MKRIVRILEIALGILLVGVVGLAIAAIVLDEPRPSGEAGPEADALARKVQAAVGVQAWRRHVGAVEWGFGGRHQHLWDRQRGLARVEWGDVTALIDLGDEGRAHIVEGGLEITGERLPRLRERAYHAFVNDAFWLNPFPKLFDEGVQRELVRLEGGGEGLLVTWTQGGVTPGDAYLWELGEDGLPAKWRMWVDIIPIGGLEVTWEDYITLPGGAKVATHHEGLFTLEITGVKSASTAVALAGGEDPFAPLFEAPGPSSRPASAPAPATAPEPEPEPEAAPAPAAKRAPAPEPRRTPPPAEEL